MGAWRAMEDEICEAIKLSLKLSCIIYWLVGAIKLVKSSVLVY
jgi:hypothetical protein